LEAGHELRNDPVPFAAVVPEAAAVFPDVTDEAVAAAVEQPVPLLLGERLPRRFQIDAKGFGDALANVPPPASHRPHRADHCHRAVGEAFLRIRNEEVGIEIMLDPETITIEAHSLRAVEAE